MASGQQSTYTSSPTLSGTASGSGESPLASPQPATITAPPTAATAIVNKQSRRRKNKNPLPWAPEYTPAAVATRPLIPPNTSATMERWLMEDNKIKSISERMAELGHLAWLDNTLSGEARPDNITPGPPGLYYYL